MGGTPRCCVCGRFAKTELVDVCTPCHEEREKEGRFIGDEFEGFVVDREFIPGNYGIMRDKFGVER